MSIWQAMATLYGRTHAQTLMTVDVVSFGSEGNTVPVVDLAGRYRRVIVWADKAKQTQAALSGLPRAKGLKSSIIDRQEADANRLLQMGRLPDLLDVLL